MKLAPYARPETFDPNTSRYGQVNSPVEIDTPATRCALAIARDIYKYANAAGIAPLTLAGVVTDAVNEAIALRSALLPPALDDTRGVGLVAAERARQIEREGWTAEHDAEHDPGELASAGASYALNAACMLYPLNGTPLDEPPTCWLWDRAYWKPKDPLRDLVRAGALIAAEIDKLLAERPDSGRPVEPHRSGGGLTPALSEPPLPDYRERS